MDKAEFEAIVRIGKKTGRPGKWTFLLESLEIDVPVRVEEDTWSPSGFNTTRASLYRAALACGSKIHVKNDDGELWVMRSA